MKNFLKVEKMSIKNICNVVGALSVRNIKRFLYFTMFMGIVLLFCRCSADNPEANFTPSATTVTVGDTVYFTNNSLNAGYYQWAFGDGSFAITKNASHAYTQNGNYAVTLVAIGNNKSNSISKNIFVTGTITIFAGVGIIEDSLTDTWASIKNKFSGQDSLMHVDSSDQYYIHSVFYRGKGIIFSFYNFLLSVIDSSEHPDEISVVNQYAGYTAKGITLGDDISKVKAAYGTPGTQTTDGNTVYYYENLGIQFWTTTMSNIIEEIDVYLPINAKSISVRKIKYSKIRDLKIRGHVTLH